MNKRQKQVAKSLLKSEADVLKSIELSYKDAITHINAVIASLYARKDTENLQSIIYQIRQQEALKSQLNEGLNKLHSNNYTLIDDYLKNCYEDCFIGTVYSITGQKVPLMLPLNQEHMVTAITLNSKLSEPLYNALGYDVDFLKVSVTKEISRGVAQALSYEEIARGIKHLTGLSKNNTMRIAQTEGHRVQNEARFYGIQKADEMGAEVVKEWDSTLDSRTRPTHQGLDGTIIPVDEYFVSSSGAEALYPGGFGVASEDIRCRCQVLERASWALDRSITKWDGFSNVLREFETPKDYDEFKSWYWNKDNMNYMSFVENMKAKYETQNFNKLLGKMDKKDYEKFKELEKNSPMFKK